MNKSVEIGDRLFWKRLNNEKFRMSQRVIIEMLLFTAFIVAIGFDLIIFILIGVVFLIKIHEKKPFKVIITDDNIICANGITSKVVNIIPIHLVNRIHVEKREIRLGVEGKETILIGFSNGEKFKEVIQSILKKQKGEQLSLECSSKNYPEFTGTGKAILFYLLLTVIWLAMNAFDSNLNMNQFWSPFIIFMAICPLQNYKVKISDKVFYFYERDNFYSPFKVIKTIPLKKIESCSYQKNLLLHKLTISRLDSPYDYSISLLNFNTKEVMRVLEERGIEINNEHYTKKI